MPSSKSMSITKPIVEFSPDCPAQTFDQETQRRLPIIRRRVITHIVLLGELRMGYDTIYSLLRTTQKVILLPLLPLLP